jgi:hypothetical protein
MDGEHLFDEKAIVARIRERLRNDVSQGAPPQTLPRPDASIDGAPEALTAELDAMDATADIGNVPLKSYRRLVGPVLSLSRKIARKIMAGAIEQQVSYNLANQRLARALRQELDILRAEQEALRRRCDALQAALEEKRRDTDGA